MRTTLTLDPDVAALLRKAIATGGKNFKETVNAALRVGLTQADSPAKPKKRFVQRTYAFGPIPSPAELKDLLLQEDIERFRRASRR